MILYVITNLLNDKRYIGITQQTLQRRWAAHISASRNPKMQISRAIAEYGPACFSIEHIASALSADALSELEQIVIQQEGTFADGYNTTRGGYGANQDSSFRAFMSLIKTGVKLSLTKAQREAMSTDRRARRHTAETKARISATKIGHKGSEAQRAAVIASNIRRGTI